MLRNGEFMSYELYLKPNQNKKHQGPTFQESELKQQLYMDIFNCIKDTILNSEKTEMKSNRKASWVT